MTVSYVMVISPGDASVKIYLTKCSVTIRHYVFRHITVTQQNAMQGDVALDGAVVTALFRSADDEDVTLRNSYVLSPWYSKIQGDGTDWGRTVIASFRINEVGTLSNCVD